MRDTGDRTVTRRALLGCAAGTGAVSLGGCLRLSSEAATPENETRSPSNSPSTTQSSGDPLEVSEFELESIGSTGHLFENEGLSVHGDERQELSGTWEGDKDIFSRQACARYSFEVLEDGSTVASSSDRVLIIGYQYVLQQSEDVFYLTYQPSVGENWERTLELSSANDSRTITPAVLPEEGVFEVDFSTVDVDPGRYSWLLKLTPTSPPHERGFTVAIGTFDDTLVSVGADTDGDLPTRGEAINTAGAVSNDDATTPKPSQDLGGDGLTIAGGDGHSGGTRSGTAGRFLSGHAGVECDSPVRFGPGTGRTFRINNLTEGTSLTFTPE